MASVLVSVADSYAITPLLHKRLRMEAMVGIGRLKRRFQAKNTIYSRLIKHYSALIFSNTSTTPFLKFGLQSWQMFSRDSRRPKRGHRDEPELVAERHDLVAQIENYSGPELLSELIAQRLECRKV